MPTTQKNPRKREQKDKLTLSLGGILPLDEVLLDAIVNGSHEGIAVIGDDFKLLYVNDQCCKVFGGTRDELIGYDFRQFINEDSLKTVTQRYLQRRSGKRVPDTYPIHLTRKDGSTVTVEGIVDITTALDGTTLTIAHVLDITPIQRGQELLEQSETRYQILVETMNDGLAIDDRKGNITYANRAFCRMLNCSETDIIGKPWVNFTTNIDEESIKRKIDERRTGISERYELTWKSSTGELVPTIVSATPLFDRSGDFIGTFAIVTEITAQKDAEETIQFYLDLLSHDVTNQLQVIMTSSGLLEEEVPQSYIADARNDILEAVERCNRLITKVKRAAQIRQIPISIVELSQILNERILVLEKVYGAKVHQQGIKKKVLVEADVLLGELIWNLLENAARHNPTENKEIWISVEPLKDVVRIAISDNGPGLSDSRKTVLFTERKHGGGVGLRLVRQMIRKYGGMIEVTDRVKDNPSEGLKFIVTLRKTQKSK